MPLRPGGVWFILHPVVFRPFERHVPFQLDIAARYACEGCRDRGSRVERAGIVGRSRDNLHVMSQKTTPYRLTIDSNIPIPTKTATRYDRKLESSDLERVARQMKKGDSVVVPSGSKGKLVKMLAERGKKTATEQRELPDVRVWVISTDQSWGHRFSAPPGTRHRIAFGV